jgi:hypothetical protein
MCWQWEGRLARHVAVLGGAGGGGACKRGGVAPWSLATALAMTRLSSAAFLRLRSMTYPTALNRQLLSLSMMRRTMVQPLGVSTSLGAAAGPVRAGAGHADGVLPRARRPVQLRGGFIGCLMCFRSRASCKLPGTARRGWVAEKVAAAAATAPGTLAHLRRCSRLLGAAASRGWQWRPALVAAAPPWRLPALPPAVRRHPCRALRLTLRTSLQQPLRVLWMPPPRLLLLLLLLRVAGRLQQGLQTPAPPACPHWTAGTIPVWCRGLQAPAGRAGGRAELTVAHASTSMRSVMM